MASEPSHVSRFTPDEQTMRDMVLAANERAERLAGRVTAATKALKRGQSAEWDDYTPGRAWR